jgi:ParB family chromosome partitioning protein
MTNTATITSATGTVEHVDPATITIETNVRPGETMAPLTKEFIASIREHGVMEPVIGYRDEQGNVVVRAGQRRTLAAREAGRPTIPVYFGAAPTDEAARIVEQLIENDQREDLTESQRAAAWQQLAFEGLSAATIAKRVGRKAAEVKTGLRVAENAHAAATVEQHTITLDQAAVLIEFEGHPEAHAELVQVAETDPIHFDHAVQQVRDKIARAEAAAALTAELTEAGWTIRDREPMYGSEEAKNLVRIDNMINAEGERIGRADVEDVEGREAVVRATYGGPQASLFIAKKIAKERKYRDAYAAAPAGPLSDEEKARRKMARENRAAWKSATAVRQQWLTAKIAGKTLPKDAINLVAEALTGNRWTMHRSLERGNATAATLVGIENVEASSYYGPNAFDGWAQDHPTKPLHAALAVVLGSYEEGMHENTWDNGDSASAAYLTRLASWGYGLSDIEQMVIDRAAERATAVEALTANDPDAETFDDEDDEPFDEDGYDDPDAA